MDTSSINILNKILEDFTVENRYFVSVNPIHSVVTNYTIPIRLPFLNDTTLAFSTQQVKYSSDSSYVWHGFLIEKDSFYQHSGNGTLISRDGQKFGSFRVDSLYFDLVDLGGNHNILIQYKYDSAINTCGVGVLDSLFPIPEPPDSSLVAEYRGTGPCPIKVLILFSNDAEDAVIDIMQTAQTSFENTLNSLNNSEIRTTDFFLELVGIELVAGFNEFVVLGGQVDPNTGNPSIPPGPEATENLLEFIREEIQDPTSEMAMLREANNADLVVLLGRVSNWIVNFSGIAAFIGPNEEAPIAVVEASRSVKNHLFEHELGHLFGCLHEVCGLSWSTHSCMLNNMQARHPHHWKSHKWGGIIKRDRFSIMFADDTKETRGYFSNPDVKTSGGKSTGTSSRNNAHWLKEMGCVISNWKINDTSPLFSYLTGPYKACPCENITITAHAEGGGPGAYSYNWSYSYDGFNFSDYPYNNSQAHLRMPCPTPSLPALGHGIYVRLEVTDSYNDTYTTWFFVELVEEDEFGVPCLLPEQRIVLPYRDKLVISVFPNPTSGLVKVELKSLSENNQTLKFRVNNVSGELLISDSWRMENGISQHSIDLKSYPAGVYFLTIFNSGSSQESESITIIKK